VTVASSVCPGCHAELRESNKFCHQCGARITASPKPAEYKQVTVLFADVVRSMDIAAALDIERLREVMTELAERSAAVARRYGGTVDYTGDGVMVIFGAPAALEDHAFRACVAALEMQHEANRVAAELQRRDGIDLRMRVGLNSGRVIAGEIGSGSLGYAATGETVGLAQRMESVAPPSGVMLSASTAHLVEHTTVLTEPEWVHVKGGDEPVRARGLLSIIPRDGLVVRAEPSMVGRRWEMAALDAMADRMIGGRGSVVSVTGSPGIGKSRVAREVAGLASSRGVEVIWAFCESHAHDVPFYAVTRLLRAATGVADVDAEAARVQLRAQLPDADPQDLVLLDDLCGIADPKVPLPQIGADARRRRLTALINTMALSRTQPALYIVEDSHWIDEVSESMLADFLTIIARTPSMVLITSRPEYEGPLTRVPGAQTIALAPLTDSDTAALLGELLGSDPSVGDLTTIIADRAAGNPFFAEEMVREFVQRGVLAGERGHYVCRADIAEVSVPATVQAAIEARIDRLTDPAKRTLNAASVIGARFRADLLAALGLDPVLDELLSVELIDQVRSTPSSEYAFHHPLIRAVAYESQLRSDRAEWHRRLAIAIQDREACSVEESAALIAEHLQAAGELHAAYGWHMRAGAWSTNRDIGAARVSWERASRIADKLSDPEPDSVKDPDTLAMRIAPRTMMCATDFQGRAVQASWGRFEELRELCNLAGDKVSLAIGMTGLATELLYTGRPGEGSRLASEQMALLESIGDPTLTVGLAFVAFANWFNGGEFGEILRWSQTVISLADGDRTKGAGFGVGSPLAIAMTFRGVARWWLGRPGWRQDLHDAVAMVRDSDTITFALVIAWTYGLGMWCGVLRADDFALCTIEEALAAAERSSNDFALTGARLTLGTALLCRDAAADRHRGLKLVVQARDRWLPEQAPSLVPVAALWVARERARLGGGDAAVTIMRQAADELHQQGRIGWDLCGTGSLVEALLDRGDAGDLAEAQEKIDRLANLRRDQNWAVRDVTLLRLRALLARARGQDVVYRDLVSRYRAMAESLGFEGHIAWAETMTESGDKAP